MPSKSPTARPLKEYRAKRNFQSTPEPSGAASKPKKNKVKQPIFCVQKHLASHLHYDFRLEHRGVLLSWAVPKGPSLNPRDKRLAMQVEDHPRDYADFEGVIPEGYGAGIVMLWDTGTWEPELPEDIDRQLARGELKFRLNGVKLKGSWVLVRTGGGPKNADGQSRSWLLIKHKDDWAGNIDVTEAAPDSVKSFGDFADILSKDKSAVWESHRPAAGGAAGAMLKQIIEEAAQRKLAAGKKASGATKKSKMRKAKSKREAVKKA